METILTAVSWLFITIIAILGFCIELPIKLCSCILTIIMYIIGLILIPILSVFDVNFSWYKPIYKYSVSTDFLTTKIINYYIDIKID